MTIQFRGSRGSSSGSTVTHADFDIGAASDDKFVIVAAGTNGSEASSVVVDGVALTKQAEWGAATSSGAFWIGRVTSGGEVDIVVTPLNSGICPIGVWTIEAGTVTLVDDAGGTTTSPGNSRAIDTAAGGFAIGYALRSGSTTWTGLTQRFSDDQGAFTSGGADLTETDGDSLTVSINAVVNIQSFWLIASFSWTPPGPVGGIADGIFDANPAHIIRECLVNSDWGMDGAPGALDDDAFRAAALTLYNEMFGLSLQWVQQTDIQSFVNEILDHIEATLFQHPRTGLLTLKLIRADYDVETLPVITPDNATLSNFQRKSWGEIVNEVIVSWTNPDSEEAETVVAQDNASISTQGLISDSRNYYGVRRRDLAMKLAHRDLRAAGAPLAICDAVLDRTQWDIVPGDVVKLTWPEYGIAQAVFRVGPVDYGKPGDPAIKVSLAEDVFGLEAGQFHDPIDSEWTDPREAANPIDYHELLTLPYWTTVRVLGADAAAAAEHPASATGVLAAQDGADTSTYDLMTEVTDATGALGFETVASRPILSRLEVADALAAEAESVVAISEGTQGDPPEVAGLVFIGAGGDEAMELAMVTAASDTEVTMLRGVLDTVPRAWPAGTPLWFVNANLRWHDPTERAAGETARYKILPRTSLGALDEADAATLELVVGGRPHLPSRPADVKVEGVGFGEVDVSGADPFTVTVAERNRLTEDSQILAWDDATVTPESGQTWKVSLLATADRAVIDTVDSLTGTSTTIAHSLAAGASSAIVRVTAERDGLESLQGHEITAIIVGEPDPDSDANWASVVFQSDFDGGNDYFGPLFDQSPNNRHMVFNGNAPEAELQTEVSKFGRSAAYINRDADTSETCSISEPAGTASSDFHPSGDFTWEGWFAFDDLGDIASTRDLFSKWRSSNGNRGYICRYHVSNGTLDFLYSTTGDNTLTINGNWSPSFDTFYFVRVKIDSGDLTIEVDGVEIASGTLAGSVFEPQQAFQLGNHFDSDGSLGPRLGGWVDSFRATKGIARNSAVPTAPFPVQGSIWGGYSWWIYPLARTEGAYTYVGHVGTDSIQRISKIHNATKIVVHTEVLNGSYDLDEHNGPANERLGNGNMMVAYTGHNDDSVVRYRVGSDIDSLGSEQTISTSHEATYIQLFVRGDDVFLFSRILNSGRNWAVFHSTDNGATWGAQQNIVQIPEFEPMYILGRTISATVVRFIVTLHGAEDGNSFRVLELDMTTGSLTTGGTSLGNIDGSTEGGNSLPAGFTDLVSIYSAPTDYTIRLLDIADDGDAYVYAETDDSDVTTYKVAYLTGADAADDEDWTHKEITAAGDFFFASSEYSGGVVFDRTVSANTALYLSREDTTWRIERWTTADGGDNWSSEEVESSTQFLIRPTSPVGASADLPVMWQRARDYTSFDDFDMVTRFR